uniref:Uncharacterized protein n=1 Tax=Pseudomonas phage HRDY3 TaxID=3236930 RepID=A0AB39CE87_9VIRU
MIDAEDFQIPVPSTQKALDRIVLQQSVKHLQQQISERLMEAVQDNLFENTPQQLIASCNAMLADASDKNLLGAELSAIDSKICTKYEIHDAKNRCLVRLMDKNDSDIKFIWLRGRRKAHKVGRSHVGSIYLAFSARPVEATRRVVFQVAVESKPQ